MSEYTNPDVLVETGWLEERLDDPNIRIVEVDEDTQAYEKGHIPNALGWNWNTDLHAPVGRDYVDQEGLANLLQKAGVGPDTTLVLYGGNNNWFAAYAYWLLRYLGYGNVKLLNGGRKKWELESRTMTSDVPSFKATTLQIDAPVNGDFRAFRDEVLQKEQAQVPGHIPGAANIPWGKAAQEDGSFKSADELKSLYEGEGITSDKEVIAYCRIGERSSHTWFALHELLGYDTVKNYDGSWTEYGSLVGVPAEKG